MLFTVDSSRINALLPPPEKRHSGSVVRKGFFNKEK